MSHTNRIGHMKAIRTSILALLLPLAGCAFDSPEESVPTSTVAVRSVSEVTPEQWATLAARRIFFGHQSVGRDIMLGMNRVLEKHPDIPVKLVNTEDPATVAGPAFIEAKIGRNREPESKDAAFVSVLEKGVGSDSNAIAMYKYCYVDVLNADPDSIFAGYVKQIDAVRAKYPGLTIVHFTMPLHEDRGGVKEFVGGVLGKPTHTKLSIKRNRYNDLLREKYQGKEPFFDLAELQSTRADGSRTFFRHKGKNIYTLAPEWTYDGGHLTDAAQDRIAEQLLVFLAQLGATAAVGPQAHR